MLGQLEGVGVIRLGLKLGFLQFGVAPCQLPFAVDQPGFHEGAPDGIADGAFEMRRRELVLQQKVGGASLHRGKVRRPVKAPGDEN